MIDPWVCVKCGQRLEGPASLCNSGVHVGPSDGEGAQGEAVLLSDSRWDEVQVLTEHPPPPPDSSAGTTALDLAKAMHADSVNLWNRLWLEAGKDYDFEMREMVERAQRALSNIANWLER